MPVTRDAFTGGIHNICFCIHRGVVCVFLKKYKCTCILCFEKIQVRIKNTNALALLGVLLQTLGGFGVFSGMQM